MAQPVTTTIAPASRPTPVGAPIIQIEGLVKRYKDFTAVNGVDLEVRAGEIFGILGPNGAGKTTTLEMIEGLRQPDSGTITVAGFDAVRESEKVRRVIGVQLQTTALFPYLTSRELIELFGNFYQLPDPAARVDELLALVDLQAKAKSRVDEMSGGQQQRLSIALALVNQPLVTFLDEPTTGLDPHARRSLWKAIQGVRDSGTTVVLTTHYMEEAEVLCDRVAIMDSGRIIACDTPANLTRSLDMEATVQVTIERGSISDIQLAGIPGVTAVDHTSEMPPRLALRTSDVQSTIVGLLDIARRDGVTLNDLTSTRATLEDVFLTLTGRKYEQQNGEGAEEEAPPKTKRRRFL
jgi:ABC-2 type transport system ATP-binding protein